MSFDIVTKTKIIYNLNHNRYILIIFVIDSNGKGGDAVFENMKIKRRYRHKLINSKIFIY